MRDRLIELIESARYWGSGTSAEIADKILADGWMRPPVNVGDKVYIVAELSKRIVECTVIGYWMCEGTCSVITDHGTIYSLSFDKTVFLTREEAEKALRGGEDK